MTQTSLKYSISRPQKRKTNPSNARGVCNNFLYYYIQVKYYMVLSLDARIMYGNVISLLPPSLVTEFFIRISQSNELRPSYREVGLISPISHRLLNNLIYSNEKEHAIHLWLCHLGATLAGMPAKSSSDIMDGVIWDCVTL